MNKEKVLVTGGCGFIGSHIVETLLEKDYEVFVIDNLSSGKRENISNGNVKIHVKDVTDEKVIDIVKEIAPQYIIHQAAQVSVPFSIENLVQDTDINIKGTINIIEGARQSGVKKIVFASSAAVYGNPEYLPVDIKHPTNPLSPYGLSKLTVEKYLALAKKIYGLDYTVLRYSNVYGPRQDALGEGGVIAIFSERITSDKSVKIFGNGEQTRDFIYVKDVAHANVKALKYGNELILNVSSAEKISINDLYNTINDILNKNVIPNYEQERAGDIVHSLLDNSNTIEELKWKPSFSLKEGLEKTLEYYQSI